VLINASIPQLPSVYNYTSHLQDVITVEFAMK